MLGSKILEERESRFNGKIKVVKTLGMGTYIKAEGLTQSGGIVETIWKQTLRKVFNSKNKIQNVLILGLGGGTLAKLINKKWPDAKIVGVDIDSVMVELGKKYLGLGKVGVDIKICDALKFFERKPSNSDNKYDLIIVDLYQGDKFPEKFETVKFLDLIVKNLSEGGEVVFNRLYFGDKRSQAVKFGNKLKKYFDRVEWVYPEANLMLVCKT